LTSFLRIFYGASLKPQKGLQYLEDSAEMLDSESNQARHPARGGKKEGISNAGQLLGKKYGPMCQEKYPLFLIDFLRGKI